ncbi:MAG: bifunctional 5,10-methylenetetrahydrofolate dehydrogenase/5,10-methenyltetrahydrofolate cyclohydrolase [bacterium]|nr:bifunctional 5,10-methylenetetrahydrofolate dehydrogenase/5,10-methenyltetrahydrofolate cyclohydrolase [bacterium]
MEIWYGKPVAEKIYQDIQSRCRFLATKGLQPGLGLLLVGNDPASEIYVRMKGEACKKYGIYSETKVLSQESTFEEVAQVIQSFNTKQEIHGFIIQLPLPKHLPERKLLDLIHPSKDVDCLTAENIGKLVLNIPQYIPCTPAGILALLEFYKVPIVSQRILVVGRSNIVGRPISILLSQKGYDATVTLAHSKTVHLKEMIQEFDGVIVAIGSPEFLSTSDIKADSWLIDVGVNRIVHPTTNSTKLVGDVRIDTDAKIKAFTPVPGGIGPLTIANLLKNCVIAASRSLGLEDF